MNYNGVVVNWTAEEAAKIAEIKARPNRQPQSPTIVEDIKLRAHRLERDLSIILLRKTTKMTYDTIANLYGLHPQVVKGIVSKAREGNYDYLGLWFCGNV